jgi:hypothetical protein
MPRLSIVAAPYRQGYGNSCAIRKGGGEISRWATGAADESAA